MQLYRNLVRPLLFCLDPELTHDATMKAAELAGALPFWRAPLQRRFAAPHRALASYAAGFDVRSPIGLSGGFDKNGRAIAITSRLGFGFLEIGSVTLNPWRGNSGCRLLRLPQEQAIWSRYGLTNDGAEAVAKRLKRYDGNIPLGVNIAAVHAGRRHFDLSLAVDELASALTPFIGVADYAVINLACPNTEGDDIFNAPSSIACLLDRIREVAPPDLPLTLKFRHRDDLAWSSELVSVVSSYPAIRSLTPSAQIMRERRFATGQPLRGAVTGRPVRDHTLAAVAQWYQLVDADRLSIVASGGIATGQDAYAAIRAGASLVKLFTALVFHGPALVRRINEELAALLLRDGFANISEAVGVDIPSPTAASGAK